MGEYDSNTKGLNAEQLRVIHTVDEYYETFYKAAKKAEKRICIAGWHFHYDTRLIINEDKTVVLLDFLKELTEEKPNLNIYISIWDASIIYDMHREIPKAKKEFANVKNVHFQLVSDDTPISSVHEKYVVIDDYLTLISGMDLTKERWDTREHKPHDERRMAYGKEYPPYFDISAVITGKVSQTFGSFFQKRWHHYGGDELKDISPNQFSLDIEPHFTNIDIDIIRTQTPSDVELSPLSEIKESYINAIKSAKKYIFIENQYFGSETIQDLIIEQLENQKDLEVIVIVSDYPSGKIEEITLTQQNHLFLKRLKNFEHSDRILVAACHIKNWQEKIHLHSKLLVVDDNFITLGSANVANRSFNYDAEINISFTSDDKETMQNIMLERIAEYLQIPAKKIKESWDKHNSLIKAVEENNNQDYKLKAIEPKLNDNLLSNTASSLALDFANPGGKKESTKVFYTLMHRVSNIIFNRITASAIVIAVLGLVVFSVYTSYGIEVKEYFYRIEEFAKNSPEIVSFGLVVLLYIVLTLMFIPLVVPITGSVVVFGLIKGSIYSLISLLIAGSIYYLAGRIAAKNKTIDNIPYSNIRNTLKVLKKHSIIAVIMTRFLPSGPFVMVNFFTGAVKIPYKNFILGSFIGLLPGLVSFITLGHSVKNLIEETNLKNGMFSLLVIIIILSFMIILGAISKRFVDRKK